MDHSSGSLFIHLIFPGSEELRDKVEKILLKSPTATEEKLQEQLTLLDLLCRHKEGAVTSADVTEAAKHSIYSFSVVEISNFAVLSSPVLKFTRPSKISSYSIILHCSKW